MNNSAWLALRAFLITLFRLLCLLMVILFMALSCALWVLYGQWGTQ